MVCFFVFSVKVWFGLAWLVLVLVLYALVRFGFVWFGSVRFGFLWFGLVYRLASFHVVSMFVLLPFASDVVICCMMPLVLGRFCLHPFSLQVLSDYKSDELDLTDEAVFRDLKKPSE